jgi:hypothetical protein
MFMERGLSQSAAREMRNDVQSNFYAARSGGVLRVGTTRAPNDSLSCHAGHRSAGKIQTTQNARKKLAAPDAVFLERGLSQSAARKARNDVQSNFCASRSGGVLRVGTTRAPNDSLSCGLCVSWLKNPAEAKKQMAAVNAALLQKFTDLAFDEAADTGSALLNLYPFNIGVTISCRKKIFGDFDGFLKR